ERADLVIGLVRDPHQTEDDVRGGDLGVRQDELLHGMTSGIGGGAPGWRVGAGAAPPCRSLDRDLRGRRPTSSSADPPTSSTGAEWQGRGGRGQDPSFGGYGAAGPFLG